MQQMVLINTRPQDAYRRQDILTASSVDLIIMLYDALKRNMIMGRRSIGKEDMQSAHKHLIKAQEIVSELINCLDMNYEISGELLSLYDYVLTCLEDANVRKNAEPLEPAVDVVDNIREAWKEISLNNRGAMHLREEQA